MTHTHLRHMILFVLILGSAVPLATTRASDAPSPHPLPDRIPASGFTGTVEESLRAGRYTIIRVGTKMGAIWAASPTADIPKGSRVVLKGGMLMKDFFSRSLDRAFPQIYFTGDVSVDTPTPHTHAAAHHATTHHATAHHATAHHVVQKAHAGAALVALDFAGITPPPGGTDIKTILAEPDAFEGKPVHVRGRVAKFTKDVLGHNWIHIQDGSAPEADLAITTDATVSVGDTVTIEGTLARNRDFGFGYLYKVLIEQAQVVVEPTAFSPSRLRTTTATVCKLDSVDSASNCGDCHETQLAQWKGSAHSQAHHDGIYRAFAELARKEGGDDLYRFCSSCHAPLAIAAGMLPDNKPEKDLPFVVNEGVTCDACHTARTIDRIHKGGGANASLIIEAGETRYGPIENPTDEASHESAHSELHTRSEFCSACHTLLHPANGLVIENTYAEWRSSPYAKAGIQCQDCHMRTVDQAIETARTMKPVVTPGPAATDGPTRNDVKSHYFVGANSNTDDSGISDEHATMARKRLTTATDMGLVLPDKISRKEPFDLTVTVFNRNAGHSIPSSITELREVWIELTVVDAKGKTVFSSGAIDTTGRVDPTARMYNAKLADKDGQITYLPWRAVSMISERLIGPKETVRETYTITPSGSFKGPLTVRTRLRYRSAPQHIMDELFGKGRFSIETVDMSTAEGTIPVTRWR